MRRLKKYLGLLAIAELLALPVPTSAQGKPTSKGGSPAVELFAQFRDAKGAQAGSGFLDKIHSDGKGPYYSDPADGYPNHVLLSEGTGSLVIQIQPSRLVDRQVIFEFDQPTRSVDYKHLTCSYRPAGPENAGLTAPASLRRHANPKRTDSVLTYISTTYEFHRQWVAGANHDKKFSWVSTGHPLNLATMPVGPEAQAFVGMDVLYRIAGDVSGYLLTFNNTGAREMSRTGIVQITHPDNRTWVLKPLPVSVGDAPFTMLALNEARRFGVVYGASRQERGWCDMGDWKMPFELTLTRRY